jgi:hypothetical protein
MLPFMLTVDKQLGELRMTNHNYPTNNLPQTSHVPLFQRRELCCSVLNWFSNSHSQLYEMDSSGSTHSTNHRKTRGRPRKQVEQHDELYEVSFRRLCFERSSCQLHNIHRSTERRIANPNGYFTHEELLSRREMQVASSILKGPLKN